MTGRPYTDRPSSNLLLGLWSLRSATLRERSVNAGLSGCHRCDSVRCRPCWPAEHDAAHYAPAHRGAYYCRYNQRFGCNEPDRDQHGLNCNIRRCCRDLSLLRDSNLGDGSNPDGARATGYCILSDGGNNSSNSSGRSDGYNSSDCCPRGLGAKQVETLQRPE